MHFTHMKDLVRAFMDKLDVHRDATFPMEVNQEIIDVGEALIKLSKKLEKKVNDPDKRFITTHLEVEEMGEFLVALGQGNEVEVLDALADRLYIFLGTCISMDMPIIKAFAEVHASNMTKEKQSDDESKARVRQKGDKYKAPDISKVLDSHRKRDAK